jgi:hypothetical protein
LFLAYILNQCSFGLSAAFVNLNASDLYKVDGCPDESQDATDDDDNDGSRVTEATVAISTVAIDDIGKTSCSHSIHHND